jgi:hypothetical protein
MLEEPHPFGPPHEPTPCIAENTVEPTAEDLDATAEAIKTNPLAGPETNDL